MGAGVISPRVSCLFSVLVQGCCAGNSLRSEPKAEARVAPPDLGQSPPPASPSLSRQGCPPSPLGGSQSFSWRLREKEEQQEPEHRKFWQLRNAGFSDANRPPGLRARPVTPGGSRLHACPWGPGWTWDRKAGSTQGRGARLSWRRAKVEGPRGRGETPHLVLAAPWTNPAQARRPHVLGPQPL